MLKTFQIGLVIYPGLVQLDALGPYQVLSFPPNTTVHLVAQTLDAVESNEGLTLHPTQTFADCPQLDVLCVPGGGLGQIEAMRDVALLNFLRQQSEQAMYVTSVCTGSMILAAAGLLQGYKATCHWMFQEQLGMLGVEVVPERVVIDRNRITGAGVTSGIDFGFVLLSQLCGVETAKLTQLMMEYDPQPPFDSGTPEQTEPEILQQFMSMGKPFADAFLMVTQEVANSLSE
ncbi:DJ-1/PfpI family protein [filamentous cyanobacterium LEGE 11480]|uniref:DJ-1/PfpI family protein n=1 Tax=Romeriopsis navalis LEGE 11480 TaxID=2777977 RepID=A0A928VMP7_9CYAN|nr:DJ-1/PfpI family protein [Romeriopsis navalis]MBE9028689.1 DJ-1/PfpI family protein [Romeriopsis navalis LEGE 11480]